MHFFKTFVVSALAVVASAQLQFTSFPPSSVTAGSGSYSLNYKTAEGMINTPVTIKLRKGSSGNLATVSTLTTSAVGGVYVFKPASGLASGDDYALSISQGTQVNYTPQFKIVGGSSSSSSSSSSSKTSAAPYPGASGNSTSGSSGATGTAVGTAASGSILPTMSRNTTFSSATISPTSTGSGSGSGSGSSASAATSSVHTGAASAVQFNSQLALALGVFGAFAYLN